MLRVVSSKVFPGVFRAIASPGILLSPRVTNAFVSVAKPSPLLSGRRFSAKAHAAQNQLVQALENEIKVMQLIPSRPSPPADFPFKIQHSTYDGQVVLSREINGEEIEIRLLEIKGGDANTETHGGGGDGSTTTDSDGYSYSDSDTCTDSDSDISSDSSEENDDGSAVRSQSISIPLKVELFKSNEKKSMKFAATAFADEIVIERLTAKKGDEVIVDELFIEPEGELQTTFREFLETKGVEQSIGGFLCDYVTWNSKLPYNYSWKEESAAKYNEHDVKALQKLKHVIEDW